MNEIQSEKKGKITKKKKKQLSRFELALVGFDKTKLTLKH